jgi:hypothetical protein
MQVIAVALCQLAIQSKWRRDCTFPRGCAEPPPRRLEAKQAYLREWQGLRRPQTGSSVQGCNSMHFQSFDHTVENQANPYRGDKEPHNPRGRVDPPWVRSLALSRWRGRSRQGQGARVVERPCTGGTAFQLSL